VAAPSRKAATPLAHRLQVLGKLGRYPGQRLELRLAPTGHSSWSPGDVPHPIIGHPGYLHVSRADPWWRVRPPDGGQIWRELELTGDQMLGDLGEAIPLAFGFDDPHLWSFFLSSKPWDGATEYARSPSPDDGRRARAADRLRIRDALAGKEFLFLFDYGDEWHFGVRLVCTSTAPTPDAQYPRVVASRGQAPP
jgi:Plasmid pRiA4b ORF-3-like protein